MSSSSTFTLPDPATLPHDTRTGTIIATTLVTLVLATLATGLRIYSRAFLIHQFGFDDVWAIATWVCFLTLCCITLASSRWLGHHIWDIKVSEIEASVFYFYLGIVFYNVSLFFVKMTFLLQYYRIFKDADRMRMVYWVAMFVVGGWSLTQVFLVIFACDPPSGFWDRTIESKCLDWSKGFLLYGNATGSLVTDLLIFIIPIPAVIHLQISRTHKWALVGIFSLGLIADASYDNYGVTCLAIAEVCSGIICAAIATMKPLLNTVTAPKRPNRSQSFRLADMVVSKRPSGESHGPGYGDTAAPTRHREDNDSETVRLRSTSALEPPSPNSSRHYDDPFSATSTPPVSPPTRP